MGRREDLFSANPIVLYVEKIRKSFTLIGRVERTLNKVGEKKLRPYRRDKTFLNSGELVDVVRHWNANNWHRHRHRSVQNARGASVRSSRARSVARTSSGGSGYRGLQSICKLPQTTITLERVLYRNVRSSNTFSYFIILILKSFRGCNWALIKIFTLTNHQVFLTKRRKISVLKFLLISY